MPTHHRGSAREIRALDTLIKLTRATESLGSRLSSALAESGLTQGQLGVLEALMHLGPMSQRELGRKLLRSNPNMTAVLDNLERDGLVQRVRSSGDRRVVTVSLSESGRKKIEAVFPEHARRVAELLGTLTDDEQELLARLCKKLGLGVLAKEGQR